MNAELRDALLDGASALKLRSELIANRTSKPEPPDVVAKRAEFERHAEILKDAARREGAR